MVRLKELNQIEKEETIKKGNFACAGCGLNIALRHALAPLFKQVSIVVPACCTSVIQGMGSGYGINVPIFNIAFAAAPAAASGVAAAYRARGVDFVAAAWAGDGGTYDIGIASLSGAAERDEDIFYFCYDNGLYSNTGGQKSGATPRSARTTSTPTGRTTATKSIARIVAAHNVPYVARASISYPRDLYDKVERAKGIKGFKFILIDQPCTASNVFDSGKTIEIGEYAVKSGLVPLYEIVDGVLTWTSRTKRYLNPEKRIDRDGEAFLDKYMFLQRRFRGANPELVELLKQDINHEIEMLRRLQEDSSIQPWE